MITTEVDGLRVLQSELLLDAGVPHGWFDRSLGDTQFRPGNPYQDPEFVDQDAMRERWTRACRALGLDAARLVQTRGLLQTDIVQTLEPEHAGTIVGPADGYITKTHDPVLLRAADCLQTVLFAPGVLGIVHAGGLGNARGTIGKVARMMRDEHGANPEHMLAALGPSIAPEHFVPSQEVDGFTLEDIADTEPVTERLSDGRVGYDIAATAVRQLLEVGLSPRHIDVSRVDTFSDPNWFSWERDRQTDAAASMRRHSLVVALPE